jgi:hypothetical protein
VHVYNKTLRAALGHVTNARVLRTLLFRSHSLIVLAVYDLHALFLSPMSDFMCVILCSGLNDASIQLLSRRNLQKCLQDAGLHPLHIARFIKHARDSTSAPQGLACLGNNNKGHSSDDVTTLLIGFTVATEPALFRHYLWYYLHGLQVDRAVLLVDGNAPEEAIDEIREIVER